MSDDLEVDLFSSEQTEWGGVGESEGVREECHSVSCTVPASTTVPGHSTNRLFLGTMSWNRTCWCCCCCFYRKGGGVFCGFLLSLPLLFDFYDLKIVDSYGL